MSLESGSELGPYRIVGLLGEGGMGQVYRAKDSRLDREVAIKVLPEAVAGDADALARFTREAQAVAALSHPGILAIHDIGDEAGRHFVVYELIDGETLRERLDGDGFDRRKAIEIASQIARGLGAAHAKGIVHRDLKPDNVMVTRDGQAKILDFGLSIWGEEGDGGGDETRTSLTNPGMVMGTVGYMAPEQVRGQPADARSDIFSFGVLLYELLTGHRAFQRETTAETMTAILREAPDEPAEAIAPGTLAILRRCLEKRPEERFHSADDLAFALESSVTRSSDSLSGALPTFDAPTARAKRGWLLPAVIGIVAAVAGLVAGNLFGSPPPDTATGAASMRLQHLTFDAGIERHPTIAPHGRTVVYVAVEDSTPHLYSRRVGGETSIRLGTGFQPAFSPDGEQIAYVDPGGGIWVMGATGESPRRLTETGYNPSWSPDGTAIVAGCESIANPTGRQKRCDMVRIDVATGDSETITTDIGDSVQPDWSPDGRRIAFWGLPSGTGKRTLYTVPAEGGEALALTDDTFFNWNPKWSADGQWLYFASDRGGQMNLWRMPIDSISGRSRGTVQPVATSTGSVGLFDLADDGSLVFASYESFYNLESQRFDFAAMRASGPIEPLLAESRDINGASMSPDRKSVAFESRTPTEDLYVYDLERSVMRRLTDDAYRDRSLLWAGDDQLVFFSDRGGRYESWRIGVDGSGLTS